MGQVIMNGEEMRMPHYGAIIEEAGQHFLFDLHRGSW